MQYHVAKNGEKLGPFSREEVYRRLTTGELNGNDLGWHEGLPEWQPLSQLLPPPQAAPPVPTLTPASVFAPGGATIPAGPAKTSGAAVGSLICGILGLFLLLPSLPAVILGHLSLSSIKKSAGTLKGRGMAIAGLITGYCAMLLTVLAVFASLVLPQLTSIMIQAAEIQTVDNAKKILIGIQQYAATHQGTLPPTLETLYEDGILTDRSLLQFPGKRIPGQGWDYPGAGMNTSSPANPIVLVSRKAGRSKMIIVGRLDGSVAMMRESEIARLER